MTSKMVTLQKDIKESLRVGDHKDVQAEYGQCFAVAYRTVTLLPEYHDATYVEGIVAVPSGVCMEHGWVEKDGRIIDPTLPDDDLAYFGGLRFNGAIELARAMLTIPKEPRCEDLPILYRFGWGGRNSPEIQEAWAEARTFSDDRARSHQTESLPQTSEGKDQS